MYKAIAIKPVHTGPMMVTWDLGRRCNYDCSYCTAIHHNNTSRHRSVDELKNTFDFIPGKIERCLDELDRILYRYFAKELHIRVLNSDEEELKKSHALHASGGASVTQQLDKMLSDAKVGPDLINSLGKGFSSLGDSVSKLNDLTDATVAANDFSKNAKNAAGQINSFAQAAATATSAVSSIGAGAEHTKV